MYREAVDIVLKGLTQETLSHAGKYWNYTDVALLHERNFLLNLTFTYLKGLNL